MAARHLLLDPTDQVDLSKIRIKKPYKVNGTSIYDIYYGENNLQIFWQTPEALLPFGYQVCQDAMMMDIVLSSEKFIHSLETVIQHIMKKLSGHVKGKKFISPIRNDVSLRLRNQNRTNVHVFNGTNSRIPLDDIKRSDKLSVIFHLGPVTCYNDIVTICLKLLQIKKMSLETCLFPTPNQPQKPSLPEKYQKMLDMGVPLPAIHHRMRMDGVPVPDALPIPATGLPKLRPVTLQPVPLVPVVKKQNQGNSKKQHAPSLSEITNALKNLRSVKQI